MSAPVILREVFQSLRGDLGEERTGVTFENGPRPLDRIDVMVYELEDPTPRTVFATIGMSIEPMPSRNGRAGGHAELRLYREGLLPGEDLGRMTMRLANLAAYPWTNGQPLGWGEIVSFDDEVPTFPHCRRVFLSGPWRPGQQDWIHTTTAPVQILNAIPLTEAERTRALTLPPQTFFTTLLNERSVESPPTRP